MGFAQITRRIVPAIVVVVSMLVITKIYGTYLNENYRTLLVISGLLALLLFRPRVSDVEIASQFRLNIVSTVGYWLLLVAILLLIGYVTKSSATFSRKALLTWAVVTPIMIESVQHIVDLFILRLLKLARNPRQAVIVGGNEIGTSLAQRISSNEHAGIQVAGYFDDRSSDRLRHLSHTDRLLGCLKDLPAYLKSHKTDVVFFALPLRSIQRVVELLDQLHDTTASIYFIPDVFVFDLIQCRSSQIDGQPIVALRESPFFGIRGVTKRLLDVTLSLGILLLISPLMLLIALGIKLSSPGSVIFKQKRYGLDGQQIIVYKFRSMNSSDDGSTVEQATRNDPRTTRFGAFLRKYSLDELPQFINVLQGRMSIVGPRPHAVAHNELYRKLIKGYMIRHKVNPGITGLAQVRGLRGATQSVDQMRKRVEADLEYLRNWSPMLDLRIILATVTKVFSDDAAY